MIASSMAAQSFLLLALISVAWGFAPTQHQNLPPVSPRRKTISSPLFSTTLRAAAVPNPFAQLPWNVEKRNQRQIRKLKLERSRLHRELGIPEDASYEEIVEATEKLILQAGDDMKKKIRIEVNKDKILQIRLNERLAGLVEASQEARAQSTFDIEGAEDDEEKNPDDEDGWKAPQWTQGLVVKPDAKHRNQQLRVWGIITLLGVGLPPSIDYMNRFTWMICIGQLCFRGMPREQMGQRGATIGFGSGPTGNKGHLKTAWLLGISISILGAVLTYGLMPAWAKGMRSTKIIAFSMRNVLYLIACSYLQPFKG